MIFVKNQNGQAVIRKCENCLMWNKIDGQVKTGYCRLHNLFRFAYSAKSLVHPITKSFYTCDSQKLVNEDELKLKYGTVEYESVEEALEANKIVT